MAIAVAMGTRQCVLDWGRGMYQHVIVLVEGGQITRIVYLKEQLTSVIILKVSVS